MKTTMKFVRHLMIIVTLISMRSFAQPYGTWNSGIARSHPFLLFTSGEVSAIKSRIGSDVYDKLWNNTYTDRGRVIYINGIWQLANKPDPGDRSSSGYADERARVAKAAAFVYVMNIDENGNDGLSDRSTVKDKVIQYLMKVPAQFE